MKIRPVGAELFHADRRTDRHDEVNSCSSQFFETRLKTTTYLLDSVIFFFYFKKF